jgi:hypothetical protein
MQRKRYETCQQARSDYRLIARYATFWIILTGVVLCSLPYALAASQIKVMLIEHGVSAQQAAFMVSVFASGVIVGRLASGLALDRLPTHWVAAIDMGIEVFREDRQRQLVQQSSKLGLALPTRIESSSTEDEP